MVSAARLTQKTEALHRAVDHIPLVFSPAPSEPVGELVQ